VVTASVGEYPVGGPAPDMGISILNSQALIFFESFEY
jgi:hypothetical protein